MSQIDFDPKEQAFIQAIFKDWQAPSYSAFLDMLIKIIENQFEKGNHLLNIGVLESIREKIFFYNADQEIEAILSGAPNLKFKPTFANTKVESLKALVNIGAAHQLILNILQNSEEPLSRQDLSDRTGLRLSSCCGRVAELLSIGTIHPCGTKADPNSGRMVETLSLKTK